MRLGITPDGGRGGGGVEEEETAAPAHWEAKEHLHAEMREREVGDKRELWVLGLGEIPFTKQYIYPPCNSRAMHLYSRQLQGVNVCM